MIMNSKLPTTLLDKLEKNIPEQIVQSNAELEKIKSVFSKIEKDTEDDYEYVRKATKNLIKKAETAIDNMSLLVEDTEAPRAYEVFMGLVRQTADMIERLLDIQEKRRKLHEKSGVPQNPSSDNKGNTFIFNGTTTELQKIIKNVTPS